MNRETGDWEPEKRAIITHLGRTEFAQFDDAMRQSQLRSKRERRVAVERAQRPAKRGDQLSPQGPVAPAARQTHDCRRHDCRRCRRRHDCRRRRLGDR